MFVKDIVIEHILPCLADPNKIRFIASIDRDVSELLPYLNSILKGAIYNHNGHTLTIRKEGRLITIHPRQIAGGKIIDEDDARKIIDWVKGLLNYCDENRDKIEPNFERRLKLQALDIYKLLPGTNCKECGEKSWLAFAVKLSEEETNVMKCKELFSTKFAERRKLLISILKDAGYTVAEVFVE